MVCEVRERAGVLQGIYGENMVLRGGYWGHPGSKMYISMTVIESRKILDGGDNMTSDYSMIIAGEGTQKRMGNNQRKYL